MARHAARRAVAHRRHLDAFLGSGQLGQRAGVAHLDLLGFRGRRAQHVRDVVGHVVAGDRQRGGVADRALHEHRDVGGAGAHVDQHHAQLALIGGQHRHAGGQRGQHQVIHLQAAALHALADVGRGRLRAHHQVGVHFQAYAGHADRVADAFLRIVQHVLARNRMQDLLVGRDRHRLGRVQHAIQVAPGHFTVADRHDARRILALHVVAGDRGVHRADLAAGHQLGFFHRALDRLHGRFDIHHHAALEPARLVRADADHFDRVARRILAHQRHHLGGADVQANDQRFVTLAIHVLSCVLLAGVAGVFAGVAGVPQLSVKPLV
ncbi:hypothetical protein G6F35_012282 [Rhizopus arrhizus]|nr:hypothetical protein G6F35_012282 [Rhizopus arrhizus]